MASFNEAPEDFYFYTGPLEDVLGEDPLSHLSPELYMMDRNAERMMVEELQDEVAKLNREIVERNREIVEKKREIVEKKREIAEKDREIAEKDKEIAKRNKEIARREREIGEKRKVLENALADLQAQPERK